MSVPLAPSPEEKSVTKKTDSKQASKQIVNWSVALPPNTVDGSEPKNRNFSKTFLPFILLEALRHHLAA